MHVLAIDEGTTGVRAMIFDEQSELVGSAYEEIRAGIPAPRMDGAGPAAHLGGDAAAWSATRCARRACTPHDLAAVGIANQRATTVVWERASGLPIYPAISLAGRAHGRARRRAAGAAACSPTRMASATKLEWVLRQRDGLGAAPAGELCFGTIDTWLVWQLSGGAVHVTDHSNASCTGLYDFLNGDWDAGGAVASSASRQQVLPAIAPSSERYGDDRRARLRRRRAGGRHRRRPAGGDVRRARRRARRGEDHLRHLGDGRRQHRRVPGAVAARRLPAHPVGAGWPALLRSRGHRDDRRRGGAMAARRPRRDRQRRPSAARSPRRCPTAAACGRCRRCRGWARRYMDPGGRAVIGGMSRGTTRAHVVRAVLEGIAYRSREALDALLERRADAARPSGCASTAARPRTTSSCSASPTSSALRSSGRRRCRRRRSAPPIWPAWAWACGAASTTSATPGARAACSRRGSAPTSARRRFHAWQRAVAAARLGAGPKAA